ncbi:PilN domain-containing protein [Halomonas sp. HMF6819]|uniref:PilN domain-containing protein n=1 Tax=unclassified Halomonas TaxID=2609666 RepID=UPI002076899C|nr:PilN domain-containing protein [Halomonas sp. S3-1-8]
MNININLLAWREARRERRTKQFYGVLALSLAMGILVALGVSLIYQQELDEQAIRNDYIVRHIEQLDQQIEDVKRYQEDVAQLNQQLALFNTLQNERIDTVELFNALAASLTDGVVYEELSREGPRVSLTATANDERQVSEQLRRLARVPGFAVPVLSEVTSAPDEQGRRFRFDMMQTLHTVEASATTEETAQ